MPYIDVKTYPELETLINSGEPCVVKIGAEWCGPCRALAPVFKSWGEQEHYGGNKINFINVDLELPDFSDRSSEFSHKFKSSGIPFLFLVIGDTILRDDLSILRRIIQSGHIPSLIESIESKTLVISNKEHKE